MLTNVLTMAGFWQKLFGMAKTIEESSLGNPAVHELIARSDDELVDYQRWKTTFVPRRMLQWIGEQYSVSLHRSNDTDLTIDFLDTPSSQGFIVHIHQTNYSRREATFLFDYFKERIQTLNYRSQISDRRTYNRRDWVETVEKHYLKPRHTFEQGKKLDQQFGNVMIELELRNDVVHNLRLRATHYVDHNYLPPQSFADLMGILLEMPG